MVFEDQCRCLSHFNKLQNCMQLWLQEVLHEYSGCDHFVRLELVLAWKAPIRMKIVLG
jgi:hypothetical protein